VTTTGTVIDNQIEAYGHDNHGSRLAFRSAVSYDPEMPTRMEILTPGLRGDGGTGFIVTGLVIVAMGLAALFVSHAIMDVGPFSDACDGPGAFCGP
jgi:hypothetical protein